MTELPLFVDPATLRAHLDRPDVQVVAVDEAGDFEAGHIPGAVRVGYADIVRNEPPVRGLLPPVDDLSATLSAIGLTADRHVVAYDRTGGSQAARLLFTLDTLGHTGLSLLDGGLTAWISAGFPLESGTASVQASDYRPSPRADRVADRPLILDRLERDNFRLLDTRTPGEYAGSDVRSRRGGHIPGAVNLDWVRLKDDRDRLRPREELLTLLAELGIAPDDEVVAYCQSHQRSSYAYMVLKALGFEHVRGYPGAWSDWGNADDTPVVTGNGKRET